MGAVVLQNSKLNGRCTVYFIHSLNKGCGALLWANPVLTSGTQPCQPAHRQLLLSGTYVHEGEAGYLSAA